MSNEEHPDPRYEGWEPTPQSGEYDADATAFVQLPPEDLANIPLAAPGHGYVPPMIVPLTPAAGLDPAATGSWVVQTQSQQQAQAERRAQEQAPGAVHWPDPNEQGGYAQPYQETSHSTAQWNFTEAMGEQPGQPGAGEGSGEYQEHTAPGDHAGHPDRTGHTDTSAHTDLSAQTDHANHTGHTGHTGQWTIPVADGDLPDESGEFLASAAAAQQWYADDTRPATLPGGAPAPWATQPQAQPQPEESPAPALPAPDEERTAAHPVADPGPETDGHPLPGDEPEAEEPPTEPLAAADAEPEAESPAAPGPEAAAAPEAEAEQGPEAEPEPDPAHDPAHDPSHDPVAAPLDVPSEHPAASYVLHVNGVDRPVSDAWIGESLLYVLRERLGLAGAKDGCSQGECGACNVQVDGRLVASCLVPAATAAGSEVRTVEGLAVDGEPSDVQRALSACGAVQCGFCIPGMAMTIHDLLEGNHAPSELETRQALCGNLCRCSGYRGVLDAVADVVAAREASAEASAAAQDEARIPHQAEPGAGGVQHQPHPHPHSHEGGAQ
ncbi:MULTISPECIES: 2Fe-2S iron-sulfur cluster-binding protein [unclassified Streptomyces]|uniref:2Fe-2S iron-sulfur cluster-binding protein n=1 Tax=unclassified Streptomyces TaxID=2593676 RepID=UPI001929B0BF|nr:MULTISPECIES: 2Fe-2S iron-sulfur cluster-binding protein [unclassified Streptomyces]CAD5954499.1 (2Fe-2S)-binding protein [Streptomyces sp. KY75]CAD5982635.1 (2Fe-2S)-binding protein [Streptomyces sp. KY70]